MNYAIINGTVVNESEVFTADLIVSDGIISNVLHNGIDDSTLNSRIFDKVIDAKGKFIFPGVIDDQVHFREPGLTHKGDIFTESKAAVAGGVTSFMDMPNVIPPTLNSELLEQRNEIAASKSLANYSFYMGASNDNLKDVLSIDYSKTCGIKVFLGSSTGNLLVNNQHVLSELFSSAKCIIAVHCEDDAIIDENLKKAIAVYGENIPFKAHADIRSAEACYSSTEFAVNLAKKFGTRLHILHLSTALEMGLLDGNSQLAEKKITAEVCIHHLWFSDKDYESKGAYIKWNPSVKTEHDRQELWNALQQGKIDVIATDHAPHNLEEKHRNYLQCPSGGPLVQHSLVAMLENVQKGLISLPDVVKFMSHNPAICFKINNRGFIRENYFADLVIVDLNKKWTVLPENILYKCGWSPFMGHEFSSQVTHTFVSGNLVYEEGVFNENHRGQRLRFNNPA